DGRPAPPAAGVAGPRKGSSGDPPAARGGRRSAGWVQPVSLRIRPIAPDSHGQRRPRAAARLRESVWTAAGARSSPSARDRDPPRDRRRTRPPRTAVAGREPGARRGGSGGGTPPRGAALAPPLHALARGARVHTS